MTVFIGIWRFMGSVGVIKRPFIFINVIANRAKSKENFRKSDLGNFGTL